MKLPSKHKLNLNRDSLIKEDFSNASIYEVSQAVQKAFGILPTIGNQLTGKFAVIRARKINLEKEDIDNPSTFGAPSIDLTGKGRANLIGYPVFYAATDSRTSMREINAIDGDEYFVSVWEKNPEVPIQIALYTLHASKETDLGNWVKDAMRFTMKKMQTLPKNRATFSHAMKLRSALFTSETYDISSKISHKLLYDRSQAADAIIYPSVVEEGRCCFAVLPSFVKKHFTLVRCYRMLFSPPPATNCRLMARGNLDGNKLTWEETGQFELDEIDYKYSW